MREATNRGSRRRAWTALAMLGAAACSTSAQMPASLTEALSSASSDGGVAILVNTAHVLRTVPSTVYGQGLLNRVASDAFARQSTFQQSVIESGVGSLRWPGAGHDNIPPFHFDNDHTVYVPNGPFTTKAAGNIWDPLYDVADAAPPTELITLGGLVDVLKNTSTTPLLVFTWRSPELWRNVAGNKVFYRDPAPRHLDGTPMPASEAATLTARELQFLENQLMLKEYFAQGGPPNPVAQIGEEVWSGWVTGQMPWAETDLNPNNLDQMSWIAQAMAPYFQDLSAFASQNGYQVRFAAQFDESTSSGDIIPLPSKVLQNLRADFDKLISSLGSYVSYMSCSAHYRGTWDQWLQQPAMQMAFMTDLGQGSLADMRGWFRQYVAAKGHPNLDLIPHADSFGGVPSGATVPAEWQKGLMASQYLFESIAAGYDYTYGYPGFGGNYDNVGVDPTEGVTGTVGGAYNLWPMYYALKLIGDTLRRNPDLVEVTGNDGTLIAMALRAVDQNGKSALSLYLINKQSAERTELVEFDTDIPTSATVSRYSQNEQQSPAIDPATVIQTDPANSRRMQIKVAPYSMTVVTIPSM